MILTSTHNSFEIYSQEKSKNDYWIKGNLASLLNLPSQVEKFGPLRLYWDGNNEHFVQTPKNTIENLRKMESYMTLKMTTMHKLNMIRYYQDISNPLERRDYKCGLHCFLNQGKVIRKQKKLSVFMLREFDDQIHIAYGVGERSILICILVTFKDKIYYQMECGVHFYSVRVIENDINRVPKSHIYESISQNVVLLPYRKPNIANELHFTVVGDDYTVLRQDASIGFPEFCIELYK